MRNKKFVYSVNFSEYISRSYKTFARRNPFTLSVVAGTGEKAIAGRPLCIQPCNALSHSVLTGAGARYAVQMLFAVMYSLSHAVLMQESG